MKEKSVIIYALTDPRTDEVRYIGKTSKSLHARLLRHVRDVNCPYKKHYHSKNWIRSLMQEGYIPEIITLEKCTEENWSDRERYYISLYKSNGFNLTNLTDGGEGHKVSDGKWFNLGKRLKVDVYDNDCNFLYTCDSMTEASEKTGCHTGKISGVCKGKTGRQSCNGYRFRYHGDSIERKRKEYLPGVSIFIVDKDFNLVKKVSSSREASDFTGVPDWRIRHDARNFTKKLRNNYIFLHEKDFLKYEKDNDNL